MIKKDFIFELVVICALFLSLANVSAITGSMGNARMVLRMDVGESVQKYILVKNVNDEALNIELTSSGDLADYITIEDKNFTLEPNSEKKAYFTITAGKNGTTETKIQVKFTPNKGNGVGLSSTIIVIASGEGEITEDEGPDVNNTQDSDFSFNPSGNVVSKNDSDENSFFESITPAKILMISTGVLVLIFIVLIVYFLSANKKPKSEITANQINKQEKKKVGRQSGK